jgi:hypothetical protein
MILWRRPDWWNLFCIQVGVETRNKMPGMDSREDQMG